jgi:hypothetical protein
VSKRAFIAALVGIGVLVVLAIVVYASGGGFLAKLGPALHGR